MSKVRLGAPGDIAPGDKVVYVDHDPQGLGACIGNVGFVRSIEDGHATVTWFGQGTNCTGGGWPLWELRKVLEGYAAAGTKISPKI